MPESKKVDVITIAFVPSKVDLSDLQPNGKLLSDAQIATIDELLKHPENILSQEDNKAEYDVAQKELSEVLDNPDLRGRGPDIKIPAFIPKFEQRGKTKKSRLKKWLS